MAGTLNRSMIEYVKGRKPESDDDVEVAARHWMRWRRKPESKTLRKTIEYLKLHHLEAREFDESKIRRDPLGKFAEKGGGSSGGKSTKVDADTAKPEYENHIPREERGSGTKKHGFFDDNGRINIRVEKEPDSRVADKVMDVTSKAWNALPEAVRGYVDTLWLVDKNPHGGYYDENHNMIVLNTGSFIEYAETHKFSLVLEQHIENMVWHEAYHAVFEHLPADVKGQVIDLLDVGPINDYVAEREANYKHAQIFMDSAMNDYRVHEKRYREAKKLGMSEDIVHERVDALKTAERILKKRTEDYNDFLDTYFHEQYVAMRTLHKGTTLKNPHMHRIKELDRLIAESSPETQKHLYRHADRPHRLHARVQRVLYAAQIWNRALKAKTKVYDIEHWRNETDKQLYVKAFLIDDTRNRNGWRATWTSIKKYARTFVGQPGIEYEACDKRGCHPDHAPVDDFKSYDWNLHKHEKYRASTIVDVILDEFTHTAFCIMRIENDTLAKNIENGTIKYLSPAIWPDREKTTIRLNPEMTGLHIDTTKWRGLHHAWIDNPAYHHKARVIEQCRGGVECVNRLKESKALYARAYRMALMARAFDESKINRDDDGKFAEKAGSGKHNEKLSSKTSSLKNNAYAVINKISTARQKAIVDKIGGLERETLSAIMLAGFEKNANPDNSVSDTMIRSAWREAIKEKPELAELQKQLEADVIATNESRKDEFKAATRFFRGMNYRELSYLLEKKDDTLWPQGYNYLPLSMDESTSTGFAMYNNGLVVEFDAEIIKQDKVADAEPMQHSMYTNHPTGEKGRPFPIAWADQHEVTVNMIRNVRNPNLIKSIKIKSDAVSPKQLTTFKKAFPKAKIVPFKALQARAYKTLLIAKAFDESKIRRDDIGRFSETGGSGKHNEKLKPTPDLASMFNIENGRIAMISKTHDYKREHAQIAAEVFNATPASARKLINRIEITDNSKYLGEWSSDKSIKLNLAFYSKNAKTWSAFRIRQSIADTVHHELYHAVFDSLDESTQDDVKVLLEHAGPINSYAQKKHDNMATAIDAIKNHLSLSEYTKNEIEKINISIKISKSEYEISDLKTRKKRLQQIKKSNENWHKKLQNEYEIATKDYFHEQYVAYRTVHQGLEMRPLNLKNLKKLDSAVGKASPKVKDALYKFSDRPHRLHARAYGVLLLAKAFDESKIRRDDIGRFSESSGGGAKANEKIKSSKKSDKVKAKSEPKLNEPYEGSDNNPIPENEAAKLFEGLKKYRTVTKNPKGDKLFLLPNGEWIQLEDGDEHFSVLSGIGIKVFKNKKRVGKTNRYDYLNTGLLRVGFTNGQVFINGHSTINSKQKDAIAIQMIKKNSASLDYPIIAEFKDKTYEEFVEKRLPRQLTGRSLSARAYALILRARAMTAKWDSSKHPRGQPDNAGQFAEVEGGTAKTDQKAKKDKAPRQLGAKPLSKEQEKSLFSDVENIQSYAQMSDYGYNSAMLELLSDLARANDESDDSERITKQMEITIAKSDTELQEMKDRVQQIRDFEPETGSQAKKERDMLLRLYMAQSEFVNKHNTVFRGTNFQNLLNVLRHGKVGAGRRKGRYGFGDDFVSTSTSPHGASKFEQGLVIEYDTTGLKEDEDWAVLDYELRPEFWLNTGKGMRRPFETFGGSHSAKFASEREIHLKRGAPAKIRAVYVDDEMGDDEFDEFTSFLKPHGIQAKRAPFVLEDISIPEAMRKRIWERKNLSKEMAERALKSI